MQLAGAGQRVTAGQANPCAMRGTSDWVKTRARDLRREMTPPEKRLWLALKSQQLFKARFSRQLAIGDMIADFVCRARKLIIEVDGEAVHHFADAHDEARTEKLNTLGYRVIRFSNKDVMNNLDAVLHAIAEALKEL